MLKYLFKLVVLNLWVVPPLGVGWGVEQLFHGSGLKPLENTDNYIMIHNNNNIAVVKWKRKQTYGWGPAQCEEL